MGKSAYILWKVYRVLVDKKQHFQSWKKHEKTSIVEHDDKKSN